VERRHHQAAVAEVERVQAAAEREEPHVAGDGGDREAGAGRGERSDDQRLPAEAVSQHAPERKEQEPEHIHARADETDRDRDVLGRDADLRKMERRECRELPVCGDLDERREREEGEHPSPAGRLGHWARD